MKDSKMMLLITILAGISVFFGIGLIFSPARGAGIAGVICIGAGVIAYDDKSLLPLAIGSACFGYCGFWVLNNDKEKICLDFSRKKRSTIINSTVWLSPL